MDQALLPRLRILYANHVNDVHRFVSRRLGAELALDVTAETFRIAFERFGAFDPHQGSELGWLYGIATNVIRNHRRAEQRRLRGMARIARESAESDDALGRVEDGVDARRRLASVLEVVAELPAVDRDLLLLFAWEGCTYTEIATAMHIPVGTVRSRLNRIRTSISTHSEVLNHE